jgi:hypothetical protein
VESLSSRDIDLKKKQEVDSLRISTDKPKLDIDSSLSKINLKKELNLNFSMESSWTRKNSESEGRSSMGMDYDVTKMNKKRGYHRGARAVEDPSVRRLSLPRDDSSARELKKSKFKLIQTDSVISNTSTSTFNHQNQLPNKCKIAYVSHPILHILFHSFIRLLIHV